jgi:signal transduction histidine kinase
VDAAISTRDPPGGLACRAGPADTLRGVFLANLTRWFLTPGPADCADGTIGRVASDGPADGRPVAGRRRPPGLLAGPWEGPDLSQVVVPRAVGAIRVVVLAMVVVTVPLSTPHFGRSALGIAIAALLAVSALAGLIWQFSEGRPRRWLASIMVLGAAGGTLAGLSALSTAVAIGFMVTVTAGARLPTRPSVTVLTETVGAFTIAAVSSGHAPAEAVVGYAAGFVGFWAFGLTRRAYLFRAVEAEQALEQARRAHDAETQAAALAERARIAREIHDVLAHSLAAVSVNLQAAAGLLEAVPGKGPELAKAVECVERAGALTREGMAETRRAILALRDDTAGPWHAAPGAAGSTGTGSTGTGSTGARGSSPAGEPAGSTEGLTARLRALADEYRGASGAAVEFTVTGTPRPLGPERALAVYRTAQEAITNALKHAPGQPVRLTVDYTAADTTLLVSNPLAPWGSEGPLAHAGTGYGLTGLRERAELVGGTLSAGPADGEWRVRLQLPA